MELVRSNVLQALILTKDEAPNIGRTLDKLTWLEKVWVLDSYSSDSTIEILRLYPNIEIRYRVFDTFAAQCNFGLSLIESEWVLSLDADYVLTDEFINETRSFLLQDDQSKVAYFTRFKFLVFGKPLTRDNTTPRAVLFRREHGSYFDDGHAHRLKIDGDAGSYRSHILHDDRKLLSRWLANQSDYSIKECDKLIGSDASQLSLTSKLRKTMVFAPIFVFFYCLFVQGIIFNGWRGWHYTLQRTIVEMLLALRLIEERKLRD